MLAQRMHVVWHDVEVFTSVASEWWTNCVAESCMYLHTYVLACIHMYAALQAHCSLL